MYAHLFAEKPKRSTRRRIWLAGRSFGMLDSMSTGTLGSPPEDGRGEHSVKFCQDMFCNCLWSLRFLVVSSDVGLMGVG